MCVFYGIFVGRRGERVLCGGDKIVGNGQYRYDGGKRYDAMLAVLAIRRRRFRNGKADAVAVGLNEFPNTNFPDVSLILYSRTAKLFE